MERKFVLFAIVINKGELDILDISRNVPYEDLGQIAFEDLNFSQKTKRLQGTYYAYDIIQEELDEIKNECCIIAFHEQNILEEAEYNLVGDKEIYYSLVKDKLIFKSPSEHQDEVNEIKIGFLTYDAPNEKYTLELEKEFVIKKENQNDQY